MALEDSYTGSGVIPINTTILGPVDADGMRGLTIQVKSIGTSGTVVVQTSLDGISWSNVQMQVVSGGPSYTNITSSGTYWCNLVGRYYRVVLGAATTAGTTSILTRLSKDEFSEMVNGIAAAVTSLPAIPAGTNTIGAVTCSMSASAAMGAQFSIHRLLASAATTNATSVKTSAGRLAQIRGYNAGAAVRYLKLYNKPSAPTVGTDTPMLTFALKSSAEFVIDVSDIGINFTTGIGYAITSGYADANTGAIAADDILCINVLYL